MRQAYDYWQDQPECYFASRRLRPRRHTPSRARNTTVSRPPKLSADACPYFAFISRVGICLPSLAKDLSDHIGAGSRPERGTEPRRINVQPSHLSSNNALRSLPESKRQHGATAGCRRPFVCLLLQEGRRPCLVHVSFFVSHPPTYIPLTQLELQIQYGYTCV